jgi:murein DD-endopeptidase MepM/ murein hydrolase activator NlpD
MIGVVAAALLGAAPLLHATPHSLYPLGSVVHSSFVSPVHKALKTQALVYPVMGPRMSSDYGLRRHPKLKKVRHHHGIDLAAPAGAPIRAIAAGTVIFADPYGGYGNLVVLRHDDGITTSHYGHCKSIKVKTGERVPTGAVLGTVGSTGISTGPHLHFEVRVAGQPHDPETLLPGLAADSDG